ncbi:4-hydroxy-3-methylbut-2-enyl diphosphate reductase [Candidatus Woesearchaeota archaeon]|nr:4-hydroxy-3-methylbut-2-enyl diphosphate reductase [Candidatus Woesearchaeota archaeon]
MKIKKAKHAGFCFGVKRAVESALKTKGEVKTLGPLIHNPQFIAGLEKKGIRAVDSVDEADKGILLIRAHGVPDSVIGKAEKKGLDVIDLTCPFVKKVQDYAKELYKQGYNVVVVGEKNHPEVIGITGNIKGIVVGDINDAKKLGHFEKLGVVAQTTQSNENFNSTVEELRKHADELKVHNTICSETDSRQRHAVELAREVDLMIVVGGYNSGNTRRLAGICSGIVETRHIEQASELKKEWFAGKKQVGLTAGASTPDLSMDKVIERIKNEF